MPLRTTHITQKLKAAATLLFLFLCVYSAVAREKNRAIALPFEDSVYNFRMLFEYDTWNRVQRIVYPDSEVVTYNYDLAGNPVAANLQSLLRYLSLIFHRSLFFTAKLRLFHQTSKVYYAVCGGAAVTNRILESKEYLIIIGQIQYYSL